MNCFLEPLKIFFPLPFQMGCVASKTKTKNLELKIEKLDTKMEPIKRRKVKPYLLKRLQRQLNAKTKILPNFDKYFCIVVCNYVTYRQFLSSIILEFCLHIWLGAVKFQRQCQQILISHIHQDEKKKNYFLNIQSIVTEHLKEKF